MIAIISAMQVEMDALLKALKNVSTTEKGKRTYYTGTLFDKNVVLVFSRWGKVASAATTTQLINDFDLDEIIFTGVAGAISHQLNIGDIVIGNKLFQHDLNGEPFYERFEIPILCKKYLETKNADKLLAATQLFLNNYTDFVEHKMALKFNITAPKVIYGDIASGDQFISTNEKLQEINTHLPSALCVEMEGAAVAQVCYEYDMPFSIMRIISDKANDNANVDFVKFSNAIASYYALGILKNYFN